ncbi:hypothetical protein TorRG33x02_182940, partial [Trema orientale]
FIQAMLRKLGFIEESISVVINCISTSDFSFVVNGKPFGSVVPQCGPRQGWPLLPLSYAEGLSSLIRHAEERKALTGFNCSRRGPIISHLFFADDSLLFCRVMLEEIYVIKDLVIICEEASRQCINF